MQTRLPHTALLAALASLIAATASAATPVILREVDEFIPTYLMDAPDPNPQFYFGGSSQGAQNRVYPYPPEFQVKNTHYDLLKEGHRCFTPV